MQKKGLKKENRLLYLKEVVKQEKKQQWNNPSPNSEGSNKDKNEIIEK